MRPYRLTVRTSPSHGGNRGSIPLRATVISRLHALACEEIFTENRTMSDLTKVKLSMILFSARFWIATFVLFFTSNGFSLSETYVLIGIYYIVSLLLEYPTGVIGDYYSHRLSVGLGYGILTIGYASFFFVGGFWYYLALLMLVAVGQALISGSDTALMHSISKDFKKDYADTKTLTLISSFLAITIGGFVATYDLRYPVLLTAAALVPASLLVFSLKNYHFERQTGTDIFELGKQAIRFSWDDKNILSLLLLGATVSGFFFSYKWIYNPIFQAIELPLGWWGFLAGIAVLFIAVGTKFYKHFSKIAFLPLLFILGISIAVSGLFSFPVVVVLGLMVSHIFQGYFETKLMVDLNEEINPSYRSSILSFKGVIVRVVSGGYIFIGALAVKYFSLTHFLIGTAVAILIMGIGALLFLRKSSLKKRIVAH